jgi:hypothetical protein
MMRSFAIHFAAGLTLVSIAAPAQSRPLRREALSVRLDGYVGTKPDTTPVEVNWTVSLKGEPYQLFVTKLQVLSGDLAYYDIINALEPYKTALTIAGDDVQLDMFATAPAQQKISVMGFLQFGGGARYLMVSKVDYVESPPAAPRTPSAAGSAP